MNTKSLVSGGVCILIGGFFSISAITSLNIGTSTNMGPGYFPFSLAILLVATGCYLGAKALGEGRDEFRFDIKAVPWRGLLLVCLAPVFLGMTIRGLGLLPSVFVTSMISAFASRTQTFRLALLVSAFLSVFCALIFSYFLKLPIPVVGPWLSI